MAKDSMIDNDLGMKEILGEIRNLGKLCAKVGFPEGSGEHDRVDIATYATWNELGVSSSKSMLKKGKLWRIPPRPFMAQTFDNYKSHFIEQGTKLFRAVADGKIDARTAIIKTASDAIGLIRKTIADGNFKENSDITIYGLGISGSARKKGERWLRTKGRKKLISGKGTGKKPLTDTATMKKSVNTVILENGSPFDKISN